MASLKNKIIHNPVEQKQSILDTPEVDLMGAVLLRAIKDTEYFLKPGACDSDSRVQTARLLRWFSSSSTEEMSLLWLCDLFNIDPKSIRDHVAPNLKLLKDIYK